MKVKKEDITLASSALSRREEGFLFLLCAMMIAGIFYSTALVTICMGGLFLLSLRHWSISGFRIFFSDYSMFPFVLLFLLVFLSGGNSSDQDTWATAVRIKLPFLIMPLAFFMLPGISRKVILQLHYWLLITCVIVGIPVIFDALIHHGAMLERLGKGQYIPAPLEHVKYSMFNAYAVLAGTLLLIEDDIFKNKVIKRFTAFGTIFIFLLMHFLAVRTGLVIVYLSLFLLGAIYGLKRRSKAILATTFAALLLIPFIAYQTVPTIRQKAGYVLHDWREYQENRGEHYSDSERIMSYKAGWEIWKSAPVMGVGYGDVGAVVHDYYVANFQRPNLFKLPHSQFLLTLTGSGILGMIIFLAGFYTPYLRSGGSFLLRGLLTVLYLNYSLSFLVENSLERSMSVAFFLVFVLLLLKGLNQEREDNITEF